MARRSPTPAMVDEIHAEPTKAFFVEMLVRDIPLEQAVLDLVDNCVDGAKRLRPKANDRYDGLVVRIEVAADKFAITDNCGGFDIDTARNYAFRFGRPSGATPTPYSVGQFGVGMKRALFKFGRHFSVASSTSSERWAVEVDVEDWERRESWNFPWKYKETGVTVSPKDQGTEIVVTRLRPEVSQRFSSEQFKNTVMTLIKSKHRQFIGQGLAISVNGEHLDATYLTLLSSPDLRPGVEKITFSSRGKKPVSVTVKVGLGDSIPREAGWYVICNGRVVLEADRSQKTGWGMVEDSGKMIPSYHNQFARFRGIVSFDCANAARLPWNTTKTDVDQDHEIWRATYPRMRAMMRPVIDFLNDLDSDIDEAGKNSSLLAAVSSANRSRVETITAKATFKPPEKKVVGPKMINILYSRPESEVDFLKSKLSVGSGKAVGEKSFDLTLSRFRST